MVVALATAIATLLARRATRVQRALSLAGGAAYALAVALLARRVLVDGATAYQLSNWPAPFGITLVADELAVFMLGLTAIVALAAVAFAVVYVDSVGQRVSFHPLYHFMLVGVTGSFLTGDIFNLFVWFEVMLMPSYVFVAFYSRRRETMAALRYVVLNLVGSAVMLVAIGGLYATTGTLNMADMARRLADAGAYGIDPAPVLGLAGLLFAVFALKAGVVPFQFWVPGAYRAAPAPVSAVLAGVTKKVGIYAIIRLSFTVFADARVGVDLALPGLAIAGDSPLPFVGAALFLMATGSILVGGIGAVGRDTMEGVFAYSSIGQVGFIAVPVAIAATTTAPGLREFAIVAALVFALNHTLAKGLLFLAVGTVRAATGTSRFADLGGMAGRSPPLAIAVFVASLALVGIPPLAGFFGKFLVFDAAARAGAGPVLALLLAGSLLTIAYTTRTWNRSFWGAETTAVEGATVDPVQVTVLVVLAAAIVAVGVGFEPVFRFAEAAAEAALDTGEYVDAVDPGTASEPIGSSGGDH
jgi:multicomponent Na+:H+ antiporter subunit D